MPTPPPTLAWRAFHLPKRGHAPAEYEDAFAADPCSGRFAVADGASESSFAGRWARLLVEGFVGEAQDPWGADWLVPLRRRWVEDVAPLPLPWYAEAKREQGAFATLLGVALGPAGPGPPRRWRALAVGDSCLFRVRAGRLSRPFPLTGAADFGNQPDLLGSTRPAGAGRLRRRRGGWRPGDRFLLMTDALAHWFLHHSEAGHRPWEALAPVLSASAGDAAFACWVEGRRDGDGLRNDDTTLILIDV